MRNTIFRFTCVLLGFSLGTLATILVTPVNLHSVSQGVATPPHNITLEQNGVSLNGAERAPASSVAQTVHILRQIKTGSMDPRIPPAAKPLLTRLKHELRDLIIDIINAPDNQQETPQHLRAMILAHLENEGVTVKEPPEEIDAEEYFSNPYVYGDIHSIKIEQPVGHPEMLAATTTLGVCCGSDSSLYLFEKKGNQWALGLAQEANDYDEVNGAQGRFSYAVSPTDARNHFFVVTANVNPWCTSNWQSLRYKVLRIGSDAYRPHVILNDRDTIFLGEELPYQLYVEKNSFTLRFTSDEFMDILNEDEEPNPEEIANSRTVKYLINGDKATRVSGPKSKAHDKASNDSP